MLPTHYLDSEPVTEVFKNISISQIMGENLTLWLKTDSNGELNSICPAEMLAMLPLTSL